MERSNENSSIMGEKKKNSLKELEVKSKRFHEKWSESSSTLRTKSLGIWEKGQTLALEYKWEQVRNKKIEIKNEMKLLDFRKRFWEYRLYGLLIITAYISIFYLLFLWSKLFLCMIIFILGIIFGQNLLNLFFQGIVFLLSGDINKISVADSIDRGTWKEDYNSSAKSVLGFLLYDEYGILARNNVLIQYESHTGNKIHSGVISYIGYYAMNVDIKNKSWQDITEDVQAKVNNDNGNIIVEFRKKTDNWGFPQRIKCF